MCLAIPGRVEEIYNEDDITMAKVDFGGIRRAVCLQCVEARKGDYVMVHVGFAISVIDEQEAARSLQMLKHAGETVDFGGTDV